MEVGREHKFSANIGIGFRGVLATAPYY